MREKKNTPDVIKGELLNSLNKTNDEEKPGIDETTKGIKEPQEAIKMMKHYKEIIKAQNKRAINLGDNQSQLLKKVQ